MKTFLGGILTLLALGAVAGPATADGPLGSPGYTPRVPVSSLGLSWFDPSRLQTTMSFSMGTGFGGRTDALQVTRFSYQVANPLWVSVSLGTSFGTGNGRSGNQFFLEGFQASYRPSPNMFFQIQYQDYRSPLQSGSFGYRHPSALDGAFAR